MEKNTHSSSCFISNVRRILEQNTIALREEHETITNLPVVISFAEEENINTAYKLVVDTLGYEPPFIRCLHKVSGHEELPATIYMLELDSYICLAVADCGLYVLDRRIYTIQKSGRNWISKLKKIVNGKTVAEYQ